MTLTHGPTLGSPGVDTGGTVGVSGLAGQMAIYVFVLDTLNNFPFPAKK